MTNSNTAGRIYVADLSAYNAGILYGVWIDLDELTDADDIGAAVVAMLEQSPVIGAEEWEVHDAEDVPRIVWGAGVEVWAEWAELIEQAADDCIPADAVREWVDNVGEVPDAADLSDRWAGQWDTFEDYAEDWIADSGMLSDVPDNLRCYFDYEKFARDLAYDHTVLDAPGGVYIFHNY